MSQSPSFERPPRVAFFAQSPEDLMSTWTFCRWPVDHAEELGLEGRMCSPSSPKVYWRMNGRNLRLRPLRMIVYWYLLVFPRRLWQLWRTRRYDVAFVQVGLLHPKSGLLLERLLALFGPPIVYHLDDALWVLRPRRYAGRVRLARILVTGSEPVVEFGRRLGTRVEVVEYPVEVERYPRREHVQRDSVVFGWTGTRPEDFLGPAIAGLTEACRKTGARFRVIGGQARPELGALDEFTDWQPWDPDRKFTALDGVDVGLMPLEDTEHNRGKEPFKLKEYMACGLPVVASPVGHNLRLIDDGRTGFFAADDEQWRECLVRLSREPALRARMGREGRRLIEERYGSHRQMGRLAEVLREAAHS